MSLFQLFSTNVPGPGTTASEPAAVAATAKAPIPSPCDRTLSVPAPGRARPWLRLLLASHAALALLIAALAGWMLWTAYASQQERAQVAVRNLAVGLGKDVAAEISRIDLALLNVKAHIEQLGGGAVRQGGAIEAILDEQKRLVPELETLRFADADGIVRYGLGDQAGHKADLSDRDYFIAARTDARPRLIVSEPLEGRITGLALLVLARRVETADGRFAGIVLTGMSSEGLRALFATVEIGRHGAISLRTASLRLVARQSGEAAGPVPIGSNQVSTELSEQLQRAPQSGSFIARTAIDAVTRANAYVAVAPYPLVLIVGLATDDFLAPWRRQATSTAGIVLLFWLGLVLSTLAVQRAWRAEQRSAQALHAASQRNCSLLLTASDGIHVLDRAGRLVECSASFAAMLGSSRADLLGRHVSSWDARMTDADLAATLAHFRSGRVEQFETVHRRADASTCEVEISATVATIDGNDYIYNSARDVSASRQARRELSQAYADLQDLYDNSPCGYHQLDAGGRFLKVNRTEATWLGSTPEALVGRDMRDFLAPECSQRFEVGFAQFKARGWIEDVEISLVPTAAMSACAPSVPPMPPAPPAPKRRVTVNASAIYGADGSFQASRTVLFDITDLHLAREAERRSAQELRATLDNSLVGIVKLRQRQAVWVNRAMTTLFGYSEAELLGRSSRLLYASDDAYAAMGALREQAFASGKAVHAQIEMVTRSGALLCIAASGQQVDTSTDESIWVLADVTAQRRSQERIDFLAYHDELTGLPNRRLLDDRLHQALAAARRSGRPLAVVYLDLDGFKAVNDQHGHAAGDVLLHEMGRRLPQVLRSADTASRIGGDEFVLLLTGLDDAEAYRPVVDRVLAELSQPIELDRHTSVVVGASAGIALYPADAADARSLMQLADAALYQAKAAGKQCMRRHRAELA